MDNYRGIYFGNNADDNPKYYEGGAHFKYKDLYKTLESLYKERYKNNYTDSEHNINNNKRFIKPKEIVNQNQTRNFKPRIQSLSGEISEMSKNNQKKLYTTRNKNNVIDDVNYSNYNDNNDNFNKQYSSDFHINKNIDINNKIFKATNQNYYHNYSNSIGNNFLTNLNLNEIDLKESYRSNINRNNSNISTFNKAKIISPILISNSNINETSSRNLNQSKTNSNTYLMKNTNYLNKENNFSEKFLQIQNQINLLKLKNKIKIKEEKNNILISRNKDIKPMIYSNNNNYNNINTNSSSIYFSRNAKSINLNTNSINSNNPLIINYKYHHNQNNNYLSNNFNDNIPSFSSNSKVFNNYLINTNVPINKSYVSTNREMRYNNNY